MFPELVSTMKQYFTAYLSKNEIAVRSLSSAKNEILGFAQTDERSNHSEKIKKSHTIKVVARGLGDEAILKDNYLVLDTNDLLDSFISQ